MTEWRRRKRVTDINNTADDLTAHRALADDVKRMAARDAMFDELVEELETAIDDIQLGRFSVQAQLNRRDLLKRARAIGAKP